MNRALMVEFFKSHRRYTGWVIGFLLAAQILWSLWPLSRMDQDDLRQGWMFLFFLFQLLDSLMMPVIVAVVMSRLCDIEHKGQTLRLVNTLMAPGRLFDVKFIHGSLYMLTATLLQLLFIFGAGKIKGFSGEPPLAFFVFYFFLTSAVNLTLVVLQLSLSLLIHNQLVAFSTGLTGAFFGLFSLFFPAEIQKLAPWGYYGVLTFIRMDWNPETRVTRYFSTPLDWVGFGLLAAMFIFIYLAGRFLFIRKEQ